MTPIVSAAVLIAAAAAAQSPSVDRSGKPQTGAASFYSAKEAGKPTASGEPLQPAAMTAASPTLPLGTQAKVTNKDNGRAVVVTINDRGPYAQNRILDVTPRAADRLKMTEQGVARVEVKPLVKPPSAPK